MLLCLIPPLTPGCAWPHAQTYLQDRHGLNNAFALKGFHLKQMPCGKHFAPLLLSALGKNYLKSNFFFFLFGFSHQLQEKHKLLIWNIS